MRAPCAAACDSFRHLPCYWWSPPVAAPARAPRRPACRMPNARATESVMRASAASSKKSLLSSQARPSRPTRGSRARRRAAPTASWAMPRTQGGAKTADHRKNNFFNPRDLRLRKISVDADEFGNLRGILFYVKSFRTATLILFLLSIRPAVC